MKNFLLLLLCAGFAILSSDANAQPTTGLKAGLNAAQLSSYDGSSRLSIHAGAFVNLKMGKSQKWRLQPEVLYSGEGQQYSFETNKRTIAIGYLQLPMMIQYLAAEKFYIEAGPQLGLLMHASSSGDDLQKLNVKRSFNNSQFAFVTGAGVRINERMRFYGRYQFGLTDVTIGDVTDNSRVIQLGISLQMKQSAKKK